MLTYIYGEEKNSPVKVKLDGRLIGEIRPVKGGYMYFVKNTKYKGDVYPTIRACQKSLEEPED